MNKISLFCLLLISLPFSNALPQATDFTGYKFFINPGHGGLDANDNHILATDFWESEGNLVKGLYLKNLLENLHAAVYLSRTTNNTEDDLALSVIDEMANEADVDCFLAIHSNGYNGTENYPLMLFRGYDDQPVFPDAKSIADLMWQNIFEKSNGWTCPTPLVKGDWTFYPGWGDKTGLGVLRTLTMPGILSEGSFHDYIPESWRLRNADYLHHESWAFLQSLMVFYHIIPVNQGIIAGAVRDTLKVPSWYFKPGTSDERLPLNGVTVTLMPGNKVYTTDTLNNGYFFFDSLAPGNYTLHFDGPADYYQDSLPVSVTENHTSIADFFLRYHTAEVPVLLSVSPVLTGNIPLDQLFTFTFSVPMDRDSVQKAIQFDPAVSLSYAWDEEQKVVQVKPTDGLASRTDYTITVTTTACSKWKVAIASIQQYRFITAHRSYLKVEKTYPADHLSEVTLYPQIRVYFDAPPDEQSASSEIRLLDDVGQPVAKVREHFITVSGKGAYYFEADQPLEQNKKYTVVLGAGLTGETGITLGKDFSFSFTTRTAGYESGNIIEPFETISNFRDPETSGSTTGTNDTLTTFTASYGVKRSGICSGQLNYTFTGTDGGLCRVFDTQMPSIGNDDDSSFGIWVFGDLSNNLLEYWFYSSGSVSHRVFVSAIDWAGWDFKTIPYSSIGATGDILFHSMVIQQAATGSTSGTIWFDNATVCGSSGTTDSAVTSPSVLFGPNPLTGKGTLRITLAAGSAVSASLYSLDGTKVKDLCHSDLNPGVWEISWVPSSSLTNGIYLIYIEITPPDTNSPEIFSEQWILAR